jgi:preprotein translocase subunit SecA
MQAKVLTNQIEGAQKKVEEQNFVMRKNVLKYDDVMNVQRQVVYEQRRRVLEGQDLSDDVRGWIDEVIERAVAEYTAGEFQEEWDLEELVKAMETLYTTEITLDELREELGEISREGLIDEFRADARDEYTAKEEEIGPELMRELERFVILQVVDQRWREHLENMDYLRDGIHLRAMAQKDPLTEYRSEGHAMFEELNAAIREEVVQILFHAQLQAEEQLEPVAAASPNGGRDGAGLVYEHESLAGSQAIAAAGATALGAEAAAATAVAPQQRVVSQEQKLGRNDPCWCGSGKKFKKCHGA